MIKKTINATVGASIMPVAFEEIDRAEMGALGSATKTTMSAGLLKKISKGWL